MNQGCVLPCVCVRARARVRVCAHVCVRAVQDGVYNAQGMEWQRCRHVCVGEVNVVGIHPAVMISFFKFAPRCASSPFGASST